MMDYYPNKSVAELLAALSSVQGRETTGALSMTTAAGVQNMRSWQGSGSTALTERRLLFSLHLRDPVTYQDPYAQRVRRSRPSYTC